MADYALRTSSTSVIITTNKIPTIHGGLNITGLIISNKILIFIAL